MDEAERMRTAVDACERVLGRGRRRSMRDRLAVLLDSEYDLVNADSPDLLRTLEERVAALLGKPAAAFFPTGTMAQQVALRCWAERTGNRTVALHPLAHPEQYERNALSTLTGLRTVHPTKAPRPFTAAEVTALDEPFGTLMAELPLRNAGFLLPAWDELTATVAAGHERGAIVHVDGARVWECSTHFGKSLDEIAALADSIYVSFYKSLGAMSGAALAGPADFIAETLAWRHRYGGQAVGQFPFALDALHGLDSELPRLPSYVAHAAVVAGALRDALAAALPWSRVAPVPPHTHQFAVWLPYGTEVLHQAVLRQAEQGKTSLFWGWTETELPGVSKTEVTVSAAGLDWTAADVEAAVREFVSYLPGPAFVPLPEAAQDVSLG
jgi:threonine aldolase